MNAQARLRLHGHAVSNYFNAVHAALIEKGVPFDLADTRASQSPEFLAINPMGKIPVLETAQGWIAETVAILEYLEDVIAAPALYPRDAFLRARARQIINVVQIYIEIPARTMYPGVFMGGATSAAAVETARPVLERGAKALGRLAELRPYLIGDRYSYADLFAFYCLNLVDRLTQTVYQWSIIDGIPAMREWFARVNQRESSRVVIESFEAAFTAYLAEKGVPYRDSFNAAGWR